MCGIAGFYGFKKDDLIKQMSKDIAHRGPDGEGFYMGDHVSLLNRRLAIIDRAGGDQPIYNEDKSILIVYNGEIYNYQEIRQELIEKGHTMSTHSDTEVVIHAYEEWGEMAFDRFNGMFAFAIYDTKKNKLVIARDHFGIKPLYYSILSSVIPDPIGNPRDEKDIEPHGVYPDGDRGEDDKTGDLQVIFSSEIKALLNSGLVEKKPNDRIIFRYLKYRIHDDQEETFFEGIKKLMPGQYMVIENGKITVDYYSSLEKKPSISSETSLNKKGIDSFKSKLVEAIKLRLISEVPVGTCLSGGLDSSTVVAVVNKLLKEHVKEAESVGTIQNTFSAVFPGSSNNEEKYIRSLLDKVRDIEYHPVYPKPEEFFKEIEDFVKTQEEPTISTGPYAQYKVMEEAHKYVTVLLDGQGADEMMAGYLPYYFVYLNQLKKNKQYGTLLKEVFSSIDVLSKYFWLKLQSNLGLKKNVKMVNLLNNNFLKEYPNEKFITTNDNLKERLNEDIFHNSLPSLLRYEDKNTMRFSIEGRVPFLDFNLLNYLRNLPDEAIINGGWNKYILRESTKEFLPTLINRRRNKIGFTTPEHEWFLHMKNKIYQIFLSESFANRKYFNQSEVLKAFQLFIEGKFDDTMVFWRMLNLEMWFRIFFDPPTQKIISEKVQKEYFDPNEGKKNEIEAEGKKYMRFPIRTELFKKGDNVSEEMKKYVADFFEKMKKDLRYSDLVAKKWFFVLSEKIVAISQGRSYFIWDIKPGFFAKILSKYVTRTPFGIGLGSPWTMQIAIDEAGLPRILVATVVAAVTKPLGIKGIFYHLVGREVASIDGPTEYSLYPSNVSAKLGPKDPEKVAEEIKDTICTFLSEDGKKSISDNFQGVVIIDANDIGRTVLGNSTSFSNKQVEEIFKDNPMGQADEQTPLTFVFCE